MKQSNFYQEWKVVGTTQTVWGVIKVEMDVLVVQTHRFMTQPPLDIDNINSTRTNKIVGYIDGIEYKTLHSDTQDGIIEMCITLKKEMNELMIEKSNTSKGKTFADKMEEIGFNMPKDNNMNDGFNDKRLICG